MKSENYEKMQHNAFTYSTIQYSKYLILNGAIYDDK